jgi:hypothetical protein
MIERNVESMIKAIRDWELEAGESFTDYFLDNYALGSWAYFLIGTGEYADWGNTIIKVKNETVGGYVDQDVKFEWFDPYCNEGLPGWCEETYLKNVKVWAMFLIASDEYYERVNNFIDQYFKDEDTE